MSGERRVGPGIERNVYGSEHAGRDGYSGGTPTPRPPQVVYPLEGELREARLQRVFPVLIEVPDEAWRSALEELACRMTIANFETWFARTSLEQRGEWAIVRGPNAFHVQWLREKYRPLVAQVLGVPPARVVFALADERVELEPEPVEDVE